MFNDVWMRENGFLRPERITLKYILDSKESELQNVISVERATTIRQAIELIKRHGISQLPVLENGRSIGLVTESNLLSSVVEAAANFDKSVVTAMEHSLPEVHMNEEVSVAVKYFMQKQPAVIITDHEKPIGIVTRFDVLEYMSH